VTSCFDEGARYGGPSDVNQLLGKSLSRHVALGDAGVKMVTAGFGGSGAYSLSPCGRGWPPKAVG
jgi:hypothetical protein